MSVSDELAKLLANVIDKKPVTKEEATELYHTLTTIIGQWVTSEIPAARRKAALVDLWAIKEIEKAVTTWRCLPSRKKA
jgi:hypothetical protein